MFREANWRLRENLVALREETRRRRAGIREEYTATIFDLLNDDQRQILEERLNWIKHGEPDPVIPDSSDIEPGDIEPAVRPANYGTDDREVSSTVENTSLGEIKKEMNN